MRKRGILQVRIIHGKGTGQLRERVHAILRRIPGVASFGLAPEASGGRGASVSIPAGRSLQKIKPSQFRMNEIVMNLVYVCCFGRETLEVCAAVGKHD